MKAAVLPVVTFGLFAMVVADRVSHALAKASPEAVAPDSSAALPSLVPDGGRQPPEDRVGDQWVRRRLGPVQYAYHRPARPARGPAASRARGGQHLSGFPDRQHRFAGPPVA